MSYSHLQKAEFEAYAQWLFWENNFSRNASYNFRKETVWQFSNSNQNSVQKKRRKAWEEKVMTKYYKTGKNVFSFCLFSHHFQDSFLLEKLLST